MKRCALKSVHPEVAVLTLSPNECVVKMNCLQPASFQISLKKGLNALKAKCDRASEVHSRGSLSSSMFPDFTRHKTAVA